MTQSDFNQPPLKVVIFVYPGATPLDFIGPAMVLNPFGEIRFYWKDLNPVFCDYLSVLPDATFADLPEHFDVLLVPGGEGPLGPLFDDDALAFVQECGRRADYITSVCTGSLILGQAGLLNGYRAATHWSAHDVLAELGATHWSAHDVLAELGATSVKARVVEDRNRITGGGVTAGIDFGLALLAKLRGPEAAKLAQLIMEYNPAPPFNAGSPEAAGPELTELAMAQARKGNEETLKLIAERKARLSQPV